MPAGILKPHPSVDDVVSFHQEDGIAGVRRLRHELTRRRFDLALNFNIYFKSIFPTLFSRAPRRVGFDRGRSRDGVWLFANQHLYAGPCRHTQDMFLEFLDALRIPREPMEWRIPITGNERLEQTAFFQPLASRPVVGVVGSSANYKKDWAAERYTESHPIPDPCTAHALWGFLSLVCMAIPIRGASDRTANTKICGSTAIPMGRPTQPTSLRNWVEWS
jgi:heptosyltransferase I